MLWWIFYSDGCNTVKNWEGMFINDVPCFLAIFDLPTYLVLLYNAPFLGLFWTPLPTLIWDVINERSQRGSSKSYVPCLAEHAQPFCTSCQEGMLTWWTITSVTNSVRPKFSLSIGNRNQGQRSGGFSCGSQSYRYQVL